jgi:hypothetical protein
MSARAVTAFLAGITVGLLIAEHLDTHSLRSQAMAQVTAKAAELRDRYAPTDPDLDNPEWADRDYVPPDLVKDGYH